MDTIAYVDQARPGQENMAIDRRLLEEAERTSAAHIRLYRWSEPTLSLGHFQANQDRNQHPPSSQLSSVLRASGGGAIVHHLEWTYAVAMPVGRNRLGAAPELYDLIHDALVAGLRELGWQASKWAKPTCQANSPAAGSLPAQVLASGEPGLAQVGCSAANSPAGRQEPFLCFLRRSCGDIVVEGYKVVGSAQRRLGGSVLQHGSILLKASPHAPELPGLFDLPQRSGAIPPYSEAQVEGFGQLVLAWIQAALESRRSSEVRPVNG